MFSLGKHNVLNLMFVVPYILVTYAFIQFQLDVLMLYFFIEKF
jgi:hypothetical protein